MRSLASAVTVSHSGDGNCMGIRPGTGREGQTHSLLRTRTQSWGASASAPPSPLPPPPKQESPNICTTWVTSIYHDHLSLTKTLYLPQLRR